jgi:predicted nucleic acid-binding protein
MLDSHVVDSSVLVASFVPSDRYYHMGSAVLKRLLIGNESVYTSAIVPVEVCAAVSRRTEDKASAMEVGRQIDKWVRLGRLRILYLTPKRMKRARDIGIECFVRGMDAIVVQAAEEKNFPL